MGVPTTCVGKPGIWSSLPLASAQHVAAGLQTRSLSFSLRAVSPPRVICIGRLPRIPPPPRRTSCRTVALHHGSRARPAPHFKTRLRPRSPCLSRLAVHDSPATPQPPPRHLLLPHPPIPRPPHRQNARSGARPRRPKN